MLQQRQTTNKNVHQLYGKNTDQRPFLSNFFINIIENQSSAGFFRAVRMATKKPHLLHQHFNVCRIVLQILLGVLFHRPFDEFVDALAREISQGGVGWVSYAFLNELNVH